MRVLLLEDCEADAELVLEHLRRSGLTVRAERVDAKADFLERLAEFEPHVVLSDHSMGPFTALDAVRVLQRARPGTPLILVTGALDEAAAVAYLKAGADDLVLKHNLARLRPAIDTALTVRHKLGRLSPRQLEVVRLLAEGQGTREIARRLSLSVKTVETHRREGMKRLDIDSIASLVRYAVRVRLVSPES